MTIFVVGYIDWGENDLHLEKIEADTWQDAVQKHSKYPWREDPEDDLLVTNRLSATDFKQACFDCDCMMAWIKI